MTTFQKLISEVGLCQIYGDSTSHCHTIDRTESMMALTALSVIQLQGDSADNWDNKVQTQSDF